MPETPNHGYNVPNEGAQDWHKPLNENFEQYDTDIEIRDTDGNKGDYDPKQGAKFLATDTGAVYLGDGSNWQPIESSGSNPSLETLTPSGDFLGVGRSSPVTSAEYFGITAPINSTWYGGMYVNVDNSKGRPFYGYATEGSTETFHHYDGQTGYWTLVNGSASITLTGDQQTGFGTQDPKTPIDITGQNNWDLDNGDGDVRIGTGSYRLAMGVALDGAGAGACNIRAKGGIERLNLGAGTSGHTVQLDPDAVSINGDLDVSGNKNFVETVDTEVGEREVAYTASEAPTPRTEVSGVADLEEGRAEVDLPDHFAWVTSDDEPLVVETTPYSVDSNGLAVVERSTDQVVLEDLEGEGDYEFAYTVKGIRDGYADKDVVREPSSGEIDGSSPTPADD